MMLNFLQALEGWGIPVIVLIILTFIFIIIQLIGEIIEVCGKTVPTFFKIRKWFKNKKQLKLDKINQDKKIATLLIEIDAQQQEVKQLLTEVNKHYDEDNITKRDRWMLDVNCKMKWIDERAKVYDRSVNDLIELTEIVKKQSDALELNNKMTSELYKQNTRTQILDFSHRLVNARKADKPIIFSREEFRKIRKSYSAYEEFLKTFGGTNGEVNDAMTIVREAEAGKLPNIEFLEDLRD